MPGYTDEEGVEQFNDEEFMDGWALEVVDIEHGPSEKPSFWHLKIKQMNLSEIKSKTQARRRDINLPDQIESIRLVSNNAELKTDEDLAANNVTEGTKLFVVFTGRKVLVCSKCV